MARASRIWALSSLTVGNVSHSSSVDGVGRCSSVVIVLVLVPIAAAAACRRAIVVAAVVVVVIVLPPNYQFHTWHG